MFLGSPLKSNNLSALAYSPNQRNAFIQQQLHQQHNALNVSGKSSQGINIIFNSILYTLKTKKYIP